MLPKITLTGTTCGFACWEAREEVCRCSCGGANHGIFKRGGEQPKRTCKIRSFWYELYSIGTGHDAWKECHDLRIEANGGTYLGKDGYVAVYHDSQPGDLYHDKRASPHQLKWPEVVNTGIKYPSIVWKRIKNPLSDGS